MVLLTAIEWEIQVSASTKWDSDVAVADDEAKCEIGYRENENNSNFCRYKTDITARWG